MPRHKAVEASDDVYDRATLDAVASFMLEQHEHMLSDDGDEILAQQGDTAAARLVLERFCRRHSELGIGTSNPQDTSLVITVCRLLTRLLAQPDAKLAKALGFAATRRTREDRRRHEVISRAVDHVQFDMGKVRTQNTACVIVAEATGLLPRLFESQLDEGNVGVIVHRRRAEEQKFDAWLTAAIAARGQ